MNDRAVALLEQYDCEVLRTRKGRGSILCDTDKGTLAFLEYRGNEKQPGCPECAAGAGKQLGLGRHGKDTAFQGGGTLGEGRGRDSLYPKDLL